MAFDICHKITKSYCLFLLVQCCTGLWLQMCRLYFSRWFVTKLYRLFVLACAYKLWHSFMTRLDIDLWHRLSMSNLSWQYTIFKKSFSLVIWNLKSQFFTEKCDKYHVVNYFFSFQKMPVCAVVGCSASQKKCKGLSFHSVRRPFDTVWEKRLINSINRCDKSFYKMHECQDLLTAFWRIMFWKSW